MSLPSYTTVKELKVKKRRYRICLKKSPGTYLKLQLKAGGGGWGAFIARRVLIKFLFQLTWCNLVSATFLIATKS